MYFCLTIIPLTQESNIPSLVLLIKPLGEQIDPTVSTLVGIIYFPVMFPLDVKFPNDLPTGWGGGVRTWDLYAVGSIATGVNGNMPTYMNSNGNIYAANAITSD